MPKLKVKSADPASQGLAADVVAKAFYLNVCLIIMCFT